VEKCDEIGKAYLEHIIGLKHSKIDSFAKGEYTERHYVGMRQGGVKDRKNDLKSFWNSVNNITKNLDISYTQEEIDWLSQIGGELGAWQYLLDLPPKGIIGSLIINAHAYK